MNNTEIFLVIAFGGEYEDRFSNVIASSLDEQKAKDYMEEKIQEEKKINDMQTALHTFKEKYETIHPRYTHDRQRDKKTAFDLLKQWYTKYTNAKTEHFTQLGWTKEDIEKAEQFRHNLKFKIEKIPLI